MSIEYGCFEAEPVFLYVQTALSDYPALQRNVTLKEASLHAVDGLVLRLTTWCLCGRVPTRTDSETIEWPDGVWQTFKSKYMPHWFVRRWPVRMASRTIKTAIHTYFVCPHLVTDDRSMHVRFMMTGRDPDGRIRTV